MGLALSSAPSPMTETRFQRLLRWTLVVVVISLLVDPAGVVGVKQAAFGLACLAAVLTLVSRPIKVEWGVDALVVLMSLSLILFWMAASSDGGHGFSDVKQLAYLVILPVAGSCNRACLKRSISSIGVIAALTVIGLFLLIWAHPDIGQLANDISVQLELGYLGLQPGFPWIPNVYFRWSIWLLFFLAISLPVSKIRALLLLFAIICTLSATLIAVAVLMIFVYWVYKTPPARLVVVSAVILFAVAVYSIAIFESDGKAISGSEVLLSERSVEIKLSHVRDWKREAVRAPGFVLLGSGPGSYIYSSATNRNVRTTEASYIDMLRKFGLLGFVVFVAYLCFTLHQCLKSNRANLWLALGLVALVVGGTTNPLVLSPMFAVPFYLVRGMSSENRYGQ